MDTIFIRDSIQEVLSDLRTARIFTFDIETTGLNPIDSRILLVQVGIGDKAYVIDYKSVNIDKLMPFLANPAITKVIHNIKFESSFIYYFHKTMIAGGWDTFLAERVLNPDSLYGSGLAEVAQRRLGRTLNKEIRKSFYNRNNIEFSDEQIKYASEDVEVLFPIQRQQEEELKKLNLEKVARLEFDCAPVTARMELAGVPIDEKGWREKILWYKEEEKRAGQAMYVELFDKGGLPEQLGMFERSAINLGSPKQILKALQQIGLDIKDTDDRTISKLNHSAAKALSEYRKIDKVLTSYSDTFLDKIHPFTGRIHPDFQQIGTETGRFSCKEPNVQQIPPEFRKYVTDAAFSIIAADYANIELRILAQVSNDPILTKAFESGADPHKSTAAAMFNIKLDDVTKEQRFTAKTLNFGILYGMGGDKLKDTLNAGLPDDQKINLTEAEAIHKRYKATYARAVRWLTLAGNRAWDQGVSTTLYGRKRFYSRPKNSLDEKAYWRQMMGLKRQGANSVIQGTNADITKLALVDLQNEIDYNGYKASIIIQVHDEIVVLAHKSQAESVKSLVVDTMLSAAQRVITDIPVVVDAHVSNVWSKG